MNMEATHNYNHVEICSKCLKLKKTVYRLETPETKFLTWLEAWLKRVGLAAFNPRRSLSDILKNGPNTCSSSGFYHTFASDIVEKWRTSYPSDLGCDQFVWTILALTILEKQQKQSFKEREPRGQRAPNSILCLLVWTGYYLRVPCKQVVQELLQEIVSCCGHLRFVFALLSGITMREYVRYMGITDAAFHDILCEKYFEDLADYDTAYKKTKLLLLYFVEHLIPLHNNKSLQYIGLSPPSFTLAQVINSPILYKRQAFSLLTLAVSRQDAPLVKALLNLGSCGCTPYYYPVLDKHWSAERTLIHYINSAMTVRSLLINSTTSINDSPIKELWQELLPKLDLLNELIDLVSTYAPMMRRSLYHSEMKKANNQWRGKDKEVGLHCDITDRWNVGDKRTFPSLQHACKITIRRQILAVDEKLIPEAVAKLPLPGVMKRYLNLELD